MPNFRGLRRRGLSGQIVSLTHESFCPFFAFFATATGRTFGRPHAQYVIMCHSGQGNTYWSLER